MGLDGSGLPEAVLAQDPGAATGGPDKAHQLADSSGLSSPVWPQKTKNLTFFHLERQVKYAASLAVIFREALHLDHRIH